MFPLPQEPLRAEQREGEGEEHCVPRLLIAALGVEWVKELATQKAWKHLLLMPPFYRNFRPTLGPVSS
jgi:hypothetical protein